MAVTTLDTHELVKDLKSAGFTDEPAEAVTRAVKQAQEVDVTDLVTKADLISFGGRIDALAARIDNIEAKLTNFVKAELAETRADLLKWASASLSARARRSLPY